MASLAAERSIQKQEIGTVTSEKEGGGPVSVANDGRDQVCLRLYIAGSTPNSQRAMVNLETALLEFVAGDAFKLEYIDVLVEGQRAAADSVILTPTLVAFGRKNRLVIIGDLGDVAKLSDFLLTASKFVLRN